MSLSSFARVEQSAGDGRVEVGADPRAIEEPRTRAETVRGDVDAADLLKHGSSLFGAFMRR